MSKLATRIGTAAALVVGASALACGTSFAASCPCADHGQAGPTQVSTDCGGKDAGKAITPIPAPTLRMGVGNCSGATTTQPGGGIIPPSTSTPSVLGGLAPQANPTAPGADPAQGNPLGSLISGPLGAGAGTPDAGASNLLPGLL